MQSIQSNSRISCLVVLRRRHWWTCDKPTQRATRSPPADGFSFRTTTQSVFDWFQPCESMTWCTTIVSTKNFKANSSAFNRGHIKIDYNENIAYIYIEICGWRPRGWAGKWEGRRVPQRAQRGVHYLHNSEDRTALAHRPPLRSLKFYRLKLLY